MSGAPRPLGEDALGLGWPSGPPLTQEWQRAKPGSGMEGQAAMREPPRPSYTVEI